MKLRAFNWDCFTRVNNQKIRCNEIFIWAHNEQSQTCLVKVRGYYSSIYIELPDDFTENKANTIITYLKTLRFPDEIHSGKFVMKKKLYGACINDNLYPHILLKIYCDRSIYNIVKVLSSEIDIPGIGPINMPYHENNIPTILKFQTEKGIEMSGWFELVNYIDEDPELSKTSIPEYYCNHTEVQQIKDTRYHDIIPPCKILSFDHEAYSERRRQMPNWENWKDVIFMTGITTKTYKQNDMKTYIFMTYKRPEFKSKSSKYCDLPFTKEEIRKYIRPEIIIKWFDKERDLIHGISKFVNEYDPDVVIGYNILGFDYSYTVKRLKRLNDSLRQMGRLIGIPPQTKDMTWESGAYGKQEFTDIKMQGRISIDLLTVMKREHKLPSYSLNYVSEIFLGENKEDVGFQEIFEYYESNDPQLHAKIANYCSTDTILPIKLFEKFHIWDNVVVTSCIVNVSINELYTRGQQLRGYYQIYRLATKQNIVVKFSPKTNDDTLEDLIGDNDDDDDDEKAKKKNKKKDQYTGATVVEPIVGLHKDVQSFDFKSLYPSIQRAYNICYTTFIPDDVFVPESRVTVMEWDDQKANKHYKFRWIKDKIGIVPQLLKNLVDQRDEARAQIKKTDDESLKIVLDMRQLQLKISANSLYGMMGVSEEKAYLPLKDGAQCVTYVGRTTIADTIEKIKNVDVAKIRAEIIKKQTGKDLSPEEYVLKPDGITPFPQQKNIIVYGDTDSCMFKFGLQDGDPGFEIGEKVAEHISNMLPPPMKLESENWFARYLIITKKRYAAIKRSDKDNPKKNLKKGEAMLDINDQYKKGLVDARRDNCLYLRETCTTTLRKIMLLEKMEDVRDYVLDRCFQLLYQNVHYEKLMISTAINQEKYKSESAFQNCLANNLRNKGFDIRVGDRIEFYFKWIPELPGVKTLKADHTDVVETIKKSRESVHIDYEMYIPKQLQKPIDQLTTVRFGEAYIKKLCTVLKYRKKMLEELQGIYASFTRIEFME